MSDIQAQIDQLKAQLKDKEEFAEKVNDPQFKSARPRFTQSDEGDTLSYWAGGTDERFFLYTDPDGNPLPKQFQTYRAKGYLPGYVGAHDEKGSQFKSFGEFIRSGFYDNDFQHRHIKSFEKVQGFSSKTKAVQGMSVQAGEDGGYLVYPEYASGILEHVYANDIFGRTDNYSVVGNTLIFTRNAETSRATGSRHGGLRGYWVGEGATLTKSKPTVRQVSCRLNKLAVVVYLTEELIQDAGPAAEQYVTRKASEEFNFMLGDAIFNGDGVGKPLGIVNGGALLAVAKETGQDANTIVSDNVDKMWARRLGPLVGGETYTWYHNQDCCPELDNLAQDVGTGGLPLYRTNQMIAQDAPQRLKGAPRQITEFQETLGTQNDLILADLSQVVSISKGGIAQEASIHVEFLTDQTAIRFIMRLDAKPWEDTPITPYKGSNTQSSFISLATRA